MTVNIISLAMVYEINNSMIAIYLHIALVIHEMSFKLIMRMMNMPLLKITIKITNANLKITITTTTFFM